MVYEKCNAGGFTGLAQAHAHCAIVVMTSLEQLGKENEHGVCFRNASSLLLRSSCTTKRLGLTYGGGVLLYVRVYLSTVDIGSYGQCCNFGHLLYKTTFSLIQRSCMRIGQLPCCNH